MKRDETGFIIKESISLSNKSVLVNRFEFSFWVKKSFLIFIAPYNYIQTNSFFFFFLVCLPQYPGHTPTNLLVDLRRPPGLVGESPKGGNCVRKVSNLRPLFKQKKTAYHLDQPPLVIIFNTWQQTYQLQ